MDFEIDVAFENKNQFDKNNENNTVKSVHLPEYYLHFPVFLRVVTNR